MNEDEMPRPIEGQLQIEIPPAPKAIGRWKPEHQIEAYAKEFGPEAAERQRLLAEQAARCSCGRQAKEDIAARDEGRKRIKLRGHEHKPGCPVFRPLPKGQTRISVDEQTKRFHAQNLSDALTRAREEGRL